MDSESSSPPFSDDSIKDCSCSCHFQSLYWNRSVKRKFDAIEKGKRIPANGCDESMARVKVENECVALREALVRQQKSIQGLSLELEEERSASTSAANEAMSMILRLQREKAEVLMEARQFKRFAEEKMAHDQQELLALEDLLYKREQLIQSLTCEVQAYKHRLMSFGYTEAEAEGAVAGNGIGNIDDEDDTTLLQFEFPSFAYPPLKCNPHEVPVSMSGPGDDAPFNLDKYAFGETPRERLQDLEFRIHQLEQTQNDRQMNGADCLSSQSFLEKEAVGQSPRQAQHAHRFSIDSSGSFSGLVKEINGQDTSDTPRTVCIGSVKKTYGFLNAEADSRNMADNASEAGEDVSDRIYTVDSVQTKATTRACDDYVATPRESFKRVDAGETDIQKLYMRLQALEADRESMRQAIISMRTEKAQLLLLREIAQQLCKEMPPERRLPVKKPSPIGSFSLISFLKWVISFFFWRRKERGSKYDFGSSASNLGLLLLLDRSPRTRHWRCLTRASAY